MKKTLLHRDYIVPLPNGGKPVEHVKGFHIDKRVNNGTGALTDEQEANLLLIRNAITKPSGFPPWCNIPRHLMRTSIDKHGDNILRENGYMHFYLDRQKKVILMAMQYECSVLFLKITVRPPDQFFRLLAQEIKRYFGCKIAKYEIEP